MKQVERIIKEVALLPQHRQTGFTRHWRDGKLLEKPTKLQIASFEGQEGYYLYYLDETDKWQTDTFHDSIKDAMEQAQSEFGVSPEEWIDVNIERCHEVDPAKVAMANRIRRTLSEGASHTSFTVRGHNAKVVVHIKWRERADVHDYDDGNWLVCDATVTVPAFKATLDFSLNAPALSDFLEQTKQMRATLSGSVLFAPMEPNISLEGKISKLGQIVWKGEAWHPLGSGNRLGFEFEGDQSYLPELISELEQVLVAFPVRGQATQGK